MSRSARAEIFAPSEIVAVHLIGNTVDASRRSVAALCPGLKCCCPSRGERTDSPTGLNSAAQGRAKRRPGDKHPTQGRLP